MTTNEHPGLGGESTLVSPAEQQVTSGYLSQEFIDARSPYWTVLNGETVFVSCGDDRPPTAESAVALAQTAPEHTLSPAQGYASIYGGPTGLAKNILVVGAAVHGEAYIDQIGGFEGAMKILAAKSPNPLTVHSAENNEHSPVAFQPEGDSPVGCAYAMGVGATSGLLVDPQNHVLRGVATEDQKRVFGTDNHTEALLRGHQIVLDKATQGKGAAFAVDRPSYKQYLEGGMSLMVLEGQHVKARTSGVISNFNLDRVGNPTAAHQADADFYRLDIAVAAKTVLEALKDSGLPPLPPELLMRAFQLDSVPVRAVLVSHDAEIRGSTDPRLLPMGATGNPWEAIRTLEQSAA